MHLDRMLPETSEGHRASSFQLFSFHLDGENPAPARKVVYQPIFNSHIMGALQQLFFFKSYYLHRHRNVFSPNTILYNR